MLMAPTVPSPLSASDPVKAKPPWPPPPPIDCTSIALELYPVVVMAPAPKSGLTVLFSLMP